MKLNLGSGQRKQEGWVNVDCAPESEPDVVADLTQPWPFEDNSADEAMAVHICEHLTAEGMKTFFQELYRVCKPDAAVLVQCPHPRCDDFINDPTHRTPVTPVQLGLLDQRFNRECKEKGFANSPLGLYWGVDFEIKETSYTPTPLYLEKNPAKAEDIGWLVKQSMEKLNQISQWTCVLRVVK